MQKTHRANSVQHIANLRQNINTFQKRIGELDVQIVRLEHVVAGLRDDNKTAQLLIAHYKAAKDVAAELDRRGSSRIAHERQQNEEEIQALNQTIEGLRGHLDLETKKYERMLRYRTASVKNLADAEKGARRQVDELTARDATITQLRDQLDRVTTDSNKKSTKIEDLRGDSSKKSAKVDDLVINGRACVTGWMNKQHSTRLRWKRETPSWPTCESYSTPWRRRRERVARRGRDSNSVTTNWVSQWSWRKRNSKKRGHWLATASMTRQMEVLVEDQILRRHELDVLRRQLDACTTSALDAQSRLQAHSDRSGRPSLTPIYQSIYLSINQSIYLSINQSPIGQAAPVGTPLTRATATPTSGVTTQLLPDPLSFMYAGSSDRGHRRRRSRDRDDDSEDRPHRSPSRRSRDHDNDSRDRYQRMSGSKRSRGRHQDPGDPGTRMRAVVIE